VGGAAEGEAELDVGGAGRHFQRQADVFILRVRVVEIAGRVGVVVEDLLGGAVGVDGLDDAGLVVDVGAVVEPLGAPARVELEGDRARGRSGERDGGGGDLGGVQLVLVGEGAGVGLIVPLVGVGDHDAAGA